MHDAAVVASAWGVGTPVVLAAVIAAAASIVVAFVARRPAANSGGAPPNPTPDPLSRPRPQLPPRPALVNRHEEMRRAVARIRSGGGVVAIEGEVGVGKSAVATELVHRLHDDAERFDLLDHAFLWIDARDSCPTLVDICRHLSLSTHHQSLSAVADDDKLDALRLHLADRKTVLVLDNLRLAEDPGSEALRALLRTVPSGSLVIASVNRTGTLEASRVPLQNLELRHVRDLILQQVDDLGLDGVGDFDDAFTRRVHAAVGGNPFMIGWFMRALVGSPQSIEEHLVALERGEGPRELWARVWGDLSETSRTVLAACAYLRGRAILEQLTVACTLAAPRVLLELKDLIGRGLVTSSGGSDQPNEHACTQGLQRFVLAQVPQATLVTFTKRLAEYYVLHFDGSWEDAGWAIPHLGAIRTVLEELFQQGDDPALQRVFRATFDIQMTLGLFDDRIRYGGLAFQSATRAGNDRGASLASSVISSTHAIRGEWPAAKEALALGLLAAEGDGSPGEKARQQREAGFLSYRSGEPRRGLDAIEGADDLAREAGDLNNLDG